MKSLHVVMAPRTESYRRLELTVTEETSIEEICEFTLQYVDPPSFSTSQRMAQSIVRCFSKLTEGSHEGLGIA